MENPTLDGAPGIAREKSGSITYHREHWILIGALLSPMLWTLVILITNPLFGIGLFGFGRGYSDMRSSILHQGSRSLLYLIGFSAFIVFFRRGTFDHFHSNRDRLKLWLRRSPGSRRLFAVFGVCLVLLMVKWLSIDFPSGAHELSKKGISLQTLFEWGQSVLNAVRLFWPFAVFLLLRSHAARWSYNQREFRNVGPMQSLPTTLPLPNESPTASFYWNRRMLWMGTGWLSMTVVNLLCNAFLRSFFKFLQESRRMSRMLSTFDYLIFAIWVAAAPFFLMAFFLLHPRFETLVVWLKRNVIPLCWLCTAMLAVLEIWKWANLFIETPTQYWSAQSQGLWNYIPSAMLSLWSLVIGVLLILSLSRKLRCGDLDR